MIHFLLILFLYTYTCTNKQDTSLYILHCDKKNKQHKVSLMNFRIVLIFVNGEIHNAYDFYNIKYTVTTVLRGNVRKETNTFYL